MKIRKSNLSCDYCITGSSGNKIKLDVAVQENDLGVTIDKDLTFWKHADRIVPNFNQIM